MSEKKNTPAKKAAAPTTPAIFANKDKEAILAESDSADFMRRIQLGAPSSKVVKKKLVDMGSFYIPNSEEPVDLGDSIEVLVVDWLPCAMEFKGAGVAPTITHDAKSKEYADIKDRSGDDDNCNWGQIVLLYLAEEKEFVTYFLSSPSARRCLKSFEAYKGKAATLHSFLKEGNHDYYIPRLKDCETPFDLPSNEEIVEAANKMVQKPAEGEGTSEVKEGRD